MSDAMKPAARIYKDDHGEWCVSFYEPTYRINQIWPCASFRAALRLYDETVKLYRSFPRMWARST